VIGEAAPKRLLTNARRPNPADRMMLTKRSATRILINALKVEKLDEAGMGRHGARWKRLNESPAGWPSSTGSTPPRSHRLRHDRPRAGNGEGLRSRLRFVFERLPSTSRYTGLIKGSGVPKGGHGRQRGQVSAVLTGRPASTKIRRELLRSNQKATTNEWIRKIVATVSNRPAFQNCHRGQLG